VTARGRVAADDYIHGTGADRRAMDDLPRVEVDPRPTLPAEATDLKALMLEIRRAVRAWNSTQGPSPRIYDVDDEAARLDWRPSGEPKFVPLDRDRCLLLLAEAIRWERPEGRRRPASRVPAIPPRHAIDALRAEPATFWFPIRRFVAAPFFRPDGTLVTTAGYDAATGYYYLEPADFRVPPVPAVPSDAPSRNLSPTEALTR
jgi:hypothetical protein